jgi:hypothetical protein
MGISPFSRSSDNDFGPAMQDPRNPDPHRFRINRIYEIADVTVVDVTYPNCTTFDGRKILVFDGHCMALLKVARVLDPHFLSSNTLIARVRPDAAGMRMLDRIAGGKS